MPVVFLYPPLTPAQPTNHLDIEVSSPDLRSIVSNTSCSVYVDNRVFQGLDALMNALKTWNGGVILISHDERFITSVANEVG